MLAMNTQCMSMVSCYQDKDQSLLLKRHILNIFPDKHDIIQTSDTCYNYNIVDES